MLRTYTMMLLMAVCCGPALFAAEPNIDYSEQIAPLLTKYCGGCHNDDDSEGDFSLETYAGLQRGTAEGPVLLAGDAENSKFIRLITGRTAPLMPPEDEPRPSDDEIALLKDWINSGAKGPQGEEPDRLAARTPKLKPAEAPQPVTAMAASPDGRMVAVGRFAQVVLYDAAPDAFSRQKPIRTIDDLPGKVTSLHFAADGRRLVVGSGVAGQGGVAKLFRVEDATLIREFKGHRDMLYDAELSPDGRTLATCGYDKSIRLWNVETGELAHELTGHNGAVYDVAFHPSGDFLVSASADDTCKVWRVRDGMRMDTLAQPLAEAYACQFTPDGKAIVCVGADKNIRVWRFISHDKPRVNPMVVARFAHESPIVRMAFLDDGRRLITSAEDRTVKLWDTANYLELKLWDNQTDVAASLAAVGDRIVLGRLDGSIDTLTAKVDQVTAADAADVAAVAPRLPTAGEAKQFAEVEPNNTPAAAMPVELPATITGVIQGETGGAADRDLYRFAAQQGEQWVIEVNAARNRSKLDSLIEVLDADGNPIERVILQAVRESYFTFRGKDANTSDDFRVFNWEEMRLDQYLYANGEVTRLYLYPRGPDSGFQVYPGQGNRWGFFDTTPLAHALGEPCYIVEPRQPGEPIIANGLPVFPIYFENDDDARRELGSDSRLIFTAPRDGEYLVNIRDVRGYQGADYTYTLTIRPRRPDFQLSVHGANLTVSAGSGKEFTLKVNRADQFDGAIRVEVAGAPPGFFIPSPIVIEEGQIEARGVIHAAADAPQPTAENAKQTKLLATTTIAGETIEREVGSLGEIKLAGPPKLTSEILPVEGGAVPLDTSPGGPLEFEIAPGETIQLKVALHRNGHGGIVDFGKEGAGRNLPYGAYVDNLGLNGLLLLDGQMERRFFITADAVTQPQSRWFHLNTGVDGGQTTRPVLLHVRGEP